MAATRCYGYHRYRCRGYGWSAHCVQRVSTFICISLRFNFSYGSSNSFENKIRDVNFFLADFKATMDLLAYFVTCMQWIRQQHWLNSWRHEIPLGGLLFPNTLLQRRECHDLFGLSYSITEIWLRPISEITWSVFIVDFACLFVCLCVFVCMSICLVCDDDFSLATLTVVVVRYNSAM